MNNFGNKEETENKHKTKNINYINIQNIIFSFFNFYCDLLHHKSTSTYDLERDKTKFNAHSI